MRVVVGSVDVVSGLGSVSGGEAVERGEETYAAPSFWKVVHG